MTLGNVLIPRKSQNSITYYATRAYTITLRTSARRSPEGVKKYARVAYVILCNSVCKVRYNECTHGDEKPPLPIRDGRVYKGNERMYEVDPGAQPLVGEQGAKPPPGGWGRSPPTG